MMDKKEPLRNLVLQQQTYHQRSKRNQDKQHQLLLQVDGISQRQRFNVSQQRHFSQLLQRVCYVCNLKNNVNLNCFLKKYLNIIKLFTFFGIEIIGSTCQNKKPLSSKWTEMCKRWRNEGFCRDGEWRNWMKENCRKTCRLCDGNTVG